MGFQNCEKELDKLHEMVNFVVNRDSGRYCTWNNSSTEDIPQLGKLNHTLRFAKFKYEAQAVNKRQGALAGAGKSSPSWALAKGWTSWRGSVSVGSGFLFTRHICCLSPNPLQGRT